MESDFVLFNVGDDSDTNNQEQKKKTGEEKIEEMNKAKKLEEEDIYRSPRVIRYYGLDFLDLKIWALLSF